MTTAPDTSIDELLQRLNTTEAGAAWAAFIDGYSRLIMKVVSQFEFAEERDSECFLYICEKLSERRFLRLQKFDAAGKASFRNWLGTVVFNLCVDWHRAEFGRATVLPAIAALPGFDRQLYHHYYEQGMSREACFQVMKSDFPELTTNQFAASLSRIHAVLTPRQRWQISVRNLRRPGAGSGSTAYKPETIVDPGPGPDVRVELAEEAAALQSAMRRLSMDQRLLLQLRFQEGLTYQRIADLEHLGDAHRARRRVQAALDVLYLELNRYRTG